MIHNSMISSIQCCIGFYEREWSSLDAEKSYKHKYLNQGDFFALAQSKLSCLKMLSENVKVFLTDLTFKFFVYFE